MDARSFFLADFQGTLFPLKTNLLLIKNHHEALKKYIAKILSDDPAHVGDNFLAQTRVYAAKPRNHLRRTVVLDPVASYFLYDLIFRNRQDFGTAVGPNRLSFGYRFEKGRPVTIHKAYTDFTNRVDTAAGLVYGHSLSFDIASYFNSIYHHDAEHWFSSLPNVSTSDTIGFGRFFREINAGRSIDFLPQGIYPAKMIGSDFLRFIELSGQIKCSLSLRFMDDIYLFDNDPKRLLKDFLRIQELLGLRSLNINPTKTIVDGPYATIKQTASAIQQELTELIENFDRPSIVVGSGAEGSSFDNGLDNDNEETQSLDPGKIERLLELLVDPKAEEADVELILSIMHEYSDSVTSHIPYLLARFPNIVKQLFKFVGLINAKDELTDELVDLLGSKSLLLEFQLFWIAVIAEEHLRDTKNFGKLILKLYDKTAKHKIARAKILEIPEQSYGLKEIRAEILKSGTSDWLSWAAAVGTRTLKKSERNHALKYFSKGSPLNLLIAECVQKL
jgi:hypothetical protein